MCRKSIPSTLVGLIFVGVTISSCTASLLQNSSEGDNPVPIEFQKLVEIDHDVHFLTSDGQDVVLPPGHYTVEAFGDGLQFTSIGRERTDSITIQGKVTTHQESVRKPEPVIIKEDDDQQLVMLLMPAGKAIQAEGSYSGVFSRHPHPPQLKPGSLSGLKLPRINSILATPAPSPYDIPPPGNITPFGMLYIKGELFGPAQGKVMLQVQVPVEKHFHVPPGTMSLPGTTPGTRRIQLEVEKWGPDQITAKMPLVAGVPDHSAVLQILDAKGIGSPGWKVPFYATRARTSLQFGENVTDFQCAIGGNPTDVSGCLKQVLRGGPGNPCFHSAKVNQEKTISGYHVNCDLAIDWDKGRDRYTIELRNGWVVEEIRWGWNPHSTSEKLNLPKAEDLTKKYKGASQMTLWVPWEISPGPDWLDYWIDVDVKGPAGILFGDRVYWKN